MEVGGPGRRVLCVGESRGYLCGDWAVAQSRFEPSILARLARESRDADEVARRLRQMGVGYVLVNEASLASLRAWFQSAMDPAPVGTLRGLFRQRLRLCYMRNWVSVHELVPPGTVGSRLPEAFTMAPGTGSASLLKCYELGQARLMAGNGAGALRIGWLMVGDHPESGLAWSMLGNALLANGRTKEAAGAYQQATRFGARNAGLYLNMGRALMAERLFGRAQYALELAAQFDPITAETAGGIDELKATVLRDIRRRMK
jgi:tetratricopeptide (TPR) repeat protein